jgi:hypothetical protein
MTAHIGYAYDAFISYSPDDKPWVDNVLLPDLTRVKQKVCTPDDFDVGVPKLTNIERFVARSRKILLVLTPPWLGNDWNQYLLDPPRPASLHRFPPAGYKRGPLLRYTRVLPAE